MNSSHTGINVNLHRYTFAFFYAYLLVVVLLLLLAGCAAVIAGAAGGTGVAYVMGDLEASMQATPDTLARAAQLAFYDLEIRTISSNATKIDARIVGRTGMDKKVVVKIKKKTGNMSHVSIRVGTFGDRNLSLAIYDQIQKHTGQ